MLEVVGHSSIRFAGATVIRLDWQWASKNLTGDQRQVARHRFP
jgi:hypothetical protein